MLTGMVLVKTSTFLSFSDLSKHRTAPAELKVCPRKLVESNRCIKLVGLLSCYMVRQLRAKSELPVLEFGTLAAVHSRCLKAILKGNYHFCRAI